MPTILPTNYYTDEALEILKGLVPEGFSLKLLKSTDRQELIGAIEDIDYLLVGGRQKIDSELLEKAQRLKMIQRTGVGLDSLDLDAISKRGIPIYVNAGVNADSVAEHALLLILAVMKQLVPAHERVQSGKWEKHSIGMKCRDLTGKTIGIIGMGQIGKRLAELVQPFRVSILYHDIQQLSEAEETKFNAKKAPLNELLSQADIVSLNCALTPDTGNLIGVNELKVMKPTAYLINTARGGLIDEDALYYALLNGDILGAALDVFAKEPVDPKNPLLTLPNIVFSPHIGGVSRDAFRRMMEFGFANIVNFENGYLEKISCNLLSEAVS